MTFGLQWYPVEFLMPKKDNKKIIDKYLIYRGLRFFALLGHREFYDKPNNTTTEDTDFQLGIDYYFDNLITQAKKPGYSILAWTNAGYRNTNFSIDDYKTFLWSGNFKIGPTFTTANNFFLPYLVADWTYVPKYEERWWENFIRIGTGIKWYPFLVKRKDKTSFSNDFLKRFNFYAELSHNIDWLGDGPTGDVEETDFKIGISFSTSGFFKQN
jgi:hypothetical protein